MPGKESHKDSPAASSSEDEDQITPYQKRLKETEDTTQKETGIPNHLFEDLCGHWRSHSYYRSRVRIFRGFAADGPFPSLTSFQFREDPHTGLTRKCSAELDEPHKNLRLITPIRTKFFPWCLSKETRVSLNS